MKITDVRLHAVAVARHTGWLNHHVIVEVEGKGGLTGIGEMSDFTHLPRYMPDVADLEATLGQLLVGRDARDIEGINRLMNENYPQSMDYYDKSNFIHCGVDIAVHDLVAKALGEPLSTLLGGRLRERIKVCFPIFRMRDVSQVEEKLAEVERRVAQGFDVFRLYAGAAPEADRRFLEAVDEQFGDSVRIKSLDFSHLLQWKEVLGQLRRLDFFPFEMVESPAPRNDFEGLAAIRHASDRAVSEHVWSFKELMELIRADAVDILNIAPIFIGGLTNARKAYAVAEAAGKRTLIGTTQEMSIGAAAMAQLGAAMPQLSDICDPTGPALYLDDVVKETVTYEDGYLLVPPATKPGLGVELDPQRLEALRQPLSWQRVSVDDVMDRTSGGPKEEGDSGDGV